MSMQAVFLADVGGENRILPNNLGTGGILANLVLEYLKYNMVYRMQQSGACNTSG